MLNSYAKRFSLKSYDGINWSGLTGFEQIVTNGVSTYYAIVYATSRIVTFNQFWIYQGYRSLPYSNTYTAKWVDGYFYFSSDNYFYKTYSNYAVIKYYQNTKAFYREFFYDSSSSKFYVAPYNLPRIDVFDISCSLIQSISLGNQQPYALVGFNRNLYASVLNNNQVLVIQDGLVTKYFTVNQCPIAKSQISSITVDSFGYLAMSCFASNQVVVYDSNGNYMNTSTSTSPNPYITAIDSKGRFVLMSSTSLDIYY